MADDTDWQSVWDDAIAKSGYAPTAFEFVRDGLGHTVNMVHDDLAADPDDEHHVNGQQLCLGLRDYAIKRYGLLARPVLNTWGVRTTEDFGRIVFTLVDSGLMRKTDDDSLEDFQGVFDFQEEFPTPLEDAVGIDGQATA